LQRQLRPADASFERQQAPERPGNPGRLHLSAKWREAFEALREYAAILRVMRIPASALIVALKY
jgi:hypothetical protein